jgi:hypothetical protein
MNTTGTWATIPGATSASYSPGAMSVNTKFRRKVMDACGVTGYSNEVEIFVYPPIMAGVIGSDQNVCATAAPDKIKLLTNCHYTDGTVTYQWQMASSMTGPWTDISGANINEYTPAMSSASSYYRLKVMSTTCSFSAFTNTSSVIVNGACRQGPRPAGGARATTPVTSEDMRVYPNPLTGNSVEVQLLTKGKVNVRMMNAEGKTMPVTVSHTGSGLMKLNFSSKPSKGMYILNVYDDNGTRTEKVIVQ